jgi:hypothetical protein
MITHNDFLSLTLLTQVQGMSDQDDTCSSDATSEETLECRFSCVVVEGKGDTILRFRSMFLACSAVVV